MARRWFVGDMDDGVLIVRDTRRECVQWVMDAALATRVLNRYNYGRGCYEYTVAGDDREDCAGYFVARLDRAEDHGFLPDQPPLYGDPDHPHEITDERAYQ